MSGLRLPRQTGIALLVGVLLLLVSAGAARLAWSPNGASSSKENKAPAASEERAVASVGYIDLDQGVVTVQPAIAGRIADVPVQEGSRVEAGATLLRLDAEGAQTDADQAAAAVRAAEAQLAEARRAPQLHAERLAQQRAAVEAKRHELAAAKDRDAHLEELAKIDQVSAADRRAAEEKAAALDAGVRAEEAKLRALQLHDPADDEARAQADLDNRRALLAKARHALQEHTLKALTSGRVLRVFVRAGDMISPQSRQPALTFAPDEALVVRAEVEQEFAGRVRVGQRAEISDDAQRDPTVYNGRVTRISDWYAPRRSTTPDVPQPLNVRTLECIVQLDSGQPPLRIGQRMRMKLIGE